MFRKRFLTETTRYDYIGEKMDAHGVHLAISSEANAEEWEIDAPEGDSMEVLSQQKGLVIYECEEASGGGESRARTGVSTKKV